MHHSKGKPLNLGEPPSVLECANNSFLSLHLPKCEESLHRKIVDALPNEFGQVRNTDFPCSCIPSQWPDEEDLLLVLREIKKLMLGSHGTNL